MEEREQITNWLKRNLSERVADNKLLNADQIVEISKSLKELLVLNEKGEAESQVIINQGNDVLEKMNEMINEKRVSNMISVKDFSEYVTKEKTVLGDFDPCKNIMGMFDILYTTCNYDLATEYINSINFEKIKHDAIPLWTLIASNPITPLTKIIPKTDRLTGLINARLEFYAKTCEYYKNNGQFETLLSDDKHKPKEYHELAAEYDSLFIRSNNKE